MFLNSQFLSEKPNQTNPLDLVKNQGSNVSLLGFDYIWTEWKELDGSFGKVSRQAEAAQLAITSLYATVKKESLLSSFVEKEKKKDQIMAD